MRINLKSGEYYDYYNIKRVEILNHEIITVNGSFAPRTKSKTAVNRLESIKNIREVNRFLRNEMKEFHADGACPHCGGLHIIQHGQAYFNKKLNNPKEKNIITKSVVTGHKCEGCGKLFSELKPVDLVIYYK